MNALVDRYVEDGIWNMNSPRETCRVPTEPLTITQAEEYELNRLALSVWKAQESVIDMTMYGTQQPWVRLNRLQSIYPDGLTMPPAIRVDTVLSEDGLRIIEVDPVSAISLGETISLIRIWQEQGYQIPDGLLETISGLVAKGTGELSLELPSEKSQYQAEVGYLAKMLAREGVIIDERAPLKLSSFPEVPANRRFINGQGWSEPTNPLWGSLSDFSDKTNLELLMCGDKQAFASYLPRIYQRDELNELDPDATIVVKPIKGMGSVGVRAMTVNKALEFTGGYIFQEKVDPRVDSFTDDQNMQPTTYSSRVSIYAGKYGLLGAQVTARPRQPTFTNVHGQADAVQTTLAISQKKEEL